MQFHARPSSCPSNTAGSSAPTATCSCSQRPYPFDPSCLVSRLRLSEKMVVFKVVNFVILLYALCFVLSLLTGSSARDISVAAAKGPGIGYDPIRRGTAPPCKGGQLLTDQSGKSLRQRLQHDPSMPIASSSETL